MLGFSVARPQAAMGVRRRRGPGPGSEPGPESGSDPVLIPPLDPGSAAYFRRALETLEEGLSDEELALFAPNVLSECARAGAAAAAAHPAGSALLLRLLPQAPPTSLGPALAALARGGLRGAAGHPRGSRALQAALAAVPRALAAPKAAESAPKGDPAAAGAGLAGAVAGLAAAARAELAAFARHPAGSFVLRALLRALGGLGPDTETQMGAGLKRKRAGPEPMWAEPAPKGAGPHPALLPLLEELAEAFEEQLPELLSPACASLCLQTALAALHHSQSRACARLCDALIGCLAPPSEDPTHSPLAAALEDPERSRLAEAALAVAGGPVLRRLFREQLRGRLLGLARHRVANHGLQRLLDHAPADVVGEALAELGPALAEPLARGHPGVLTALAGACRRLGAHGPEAARCILQAVGCWEPPERRPACVRPLAELRPFREGDGDEQGAEIKVTPQGSLLLQHLLHLGGAGGGAAGAGLEALPPPALAALALAPPGAALWGALLAAPPPDGPPRRHRLLRKLRGHLGALSRSPHGCRVLEAAWAAAPGPARADMAAELAAQGAELRREPWGRRLCRAWRLELLLRSPHEWRRRLQEDPAATERRARP